jgi:Fuc2NAc and GlcNAc transferase
MSAVLLPGFALALSWSLTAFVLRRAPMDRPTDRSLHEVPTPRGGGLGLVVAVLVVTALAWGLGEVGRGLAVALLGGGSLVAAVGWWDDHQGLSARVRFVAHLAAAAWAVAWMGGMPTLSLGSQVVVLGPVGAVLATIALVWGINLYNFMDGIDGLAGLEAVCVGVGAALLLWPTGGPAAATLPLTLAAAAAGFLAWNWAPARIFMGDVGSGFLGLAIGVLALAGERSFGVPSLAWVTLGMVFLLDATVTLLRRGLRGERVYAAHRSHAYQRLVRAGWSHRRVALCVLGLNLVLIGLSRLPTLLGVVVSVAVVGLGYLMAGRVRAM